MSTHRTAVFGAAGQLGRELVRTFKSRGHDVHAFTRNTAPLTDEAAVDRWLAQTQPALVLNAAAYNQVDAAEQEPEAALAVNTLAVRHLARACARHNARLIHFSTDYVFDGDAARPYRESDLPRPLGVYGASKLAGEAMAQAYAENALVIRVAAVFGPAGAHTPRGNFVETVLRLAAQGKPLRIVSDQVTSPTYTVALAERTFDLWAAGARGIVHAGGGTPVSWHHFAALILRAAGVQAPLTPIATSEYPTPARRPAYSALGNVRLAELGIAPFPPLADSLTSYFERRSIT